MSSLIKWEPMPLIPNDLAIKSLIDDSSGFKLSLYNAEVDIQKAETIYWVEFDFYYGYRNLDESYHLNTWRKMPFPNERWSLFKVSVGDFIDSFNQLTLNLYKENIINYMIITPNDVVEILTSISTNVTFKKYEQ